MSFIKNNTNKDKYNSDYLTDTSQFMRQCHPNSQIKRLVLNKI